MNYGMILYILCWVLQFEALFLTLPAACSWIYHETCGNSFLIVAAFAYVVGFVGTRKKPSSNVFYAKEGFVTVCLSWILLSLVGALPFFISGEIPNFTNALFETISGFTTTGATILGNVEGLSYSMRFWRSFTHWIGGMGVLVFLMAVLPLAGGYNMHLMRAEAPGPNVGKLVPRIKETAKILYGIYIVLTMFEIAALLFAGMNMYESINLSFATLGTGGFGILNSSIASYSTTVKIIITIFMVLASLNFNVYYMIMVRKPKAALKCEEMRWHLIILGLSILFMTINIRHMFPNIKDALVEAAFQGASIMSSTGFATTDFNLWPEFSKAILVILMIIGASAGSTGGGIKVSRVITIAKALKKELSYIVHPRSIKKLSLEGHSIPHETLRSINAFVICYGFFVFISLLIISLDNFDFTTNFTAIIACLNNIGPGIGGVGPMETFDKFSDMSKYTLMFNMLAGRLELFPMLVLFSPSTWRSR